MILANLIPVSAVCRKNELSYVDSIVNVYYAVFVVIAKEVLECILRDICSWLRKDELSDDDSIVDIS